MPYKDPRDQAEAARRWRETHRGVIRERYVSRHRGRALALWREHYAADPGRFRERARRAYQKRGDLARTEQAAYYARNRVRIIARVRAYKRLHPEIDAAYAAARRARERNAIGTHTAREWLEKIALFGGCCAYCGEARPLTRDHRIPLARGGTHDIANILPACLSCNSSKRALTDVEFIARRGQG